MGSWPQGIVELDWCGFRMTGGRLNLRFPGWPKALVLPGVSITPRDFSPPACLNPSRTLFAVDYVRGFGANGIAGSTPAISVTPASDLHDGEAVQVQVSGFDIGGKFWVSECATVAEANYAGCGEQLASQPFGLTDVSGHGTLVFQVYVNAGTTPYNPSSTQACTDQCVIIATEGIGSAFAYTRVSFASG